MEIKKIKGINVIKISVLVLSIILFTNMILNTIFLYKNGEESGIVFFAFVFGMMVGLIVRVGLTLLFWASYNIKYPDEEFNEKIGKKVIAYFLYMMALMGFRLSRGTLLIFVICTLLLVIREQKKLDEVQKQIK